MTDLVIAEKNILLFLDQTINLLFISSIKIDLSLCGETFPAIFMILRRIESEQIIIFQFESTKAAAEAATPFPTFFPLLPLSQRTLIIPPQRSLVLFNSVDSLQEEKTQFCFEQVFSSSSFSNQSFCGQLNPGSRKTECRTLWTTWHNGKRSRFAPSSPGFNSWRSP